MIHALYGLLQTPEFGSGSPSLHHLLTATSVLGNLYVDDFQVYLHCHVSNATATILMMSKTWVSCKPGYRLTT